MLLQPQKKIALSVAKMRHDNLIVIFECGWILFRLIRNINIKTCSSFLDASTYVCVLYKEVFLSGWYSKKRS